MYVEPGTVSVVSRLTNMKREIEQHQREDEAQGYPHDHPVRQATRRAALAFTRACAVAGVQVDDLA